MSDAYVLSLCILIALLGAGGILGVMRFGRYLFDQSLDKFFPHPHFWEHIFHRMEKGGSYRDNFLARQLADTYSDFLQRRNEFWTAYGQTLLAILIIVVLAVLLLTKTISAEAGLPILSAVSGFAIAKGVAGGRTGSGPQEGPQG
jgi:hypothetical protein